MNDKQKTAHVKSCEPFWKCGKCGNTVQALTPPEKCPSCNEKCVFKDVSCYTPECGGPGAIDPRL
jgi:rubrerythrin